MKENTSVVVSLDGEVWGIWSIDRDLRPEQETKLKEAIWTALKESDSLITPHVEFINNVECDSFNELMDGILETIHNEFDEETD